MKKQHTLTREKLVKTLLTVVMSIISIIYVLPVAPWEAALGATVEVPTLGGAVGLKVPADSDSGRTLRLRGRGLPGVRGGRDGDQIVILEVMAPRAGDEAQRQAYRDLQQAFGEGWRRV